MAHDRVRGNHDELKQISSMFSQEAENTQKSLQDLKSRMETLRGGDWKGNVSPMVYVVGIAVAPWVPLAAGLLYTVVALVWLVPDRRIERVLREG